MSRNEYQTQRRLHRKLSRLLKFAYQIADRDMRVRAIAHIQTRLAELGA